MKNSQAMAQAAEVESNDINPQQQIIENLLNVSLENLISSFCISIYMSFCVVERKCSD